MKDSVGEWSGGGERGEWNRNQTSFLDGWGRIGAFQWAWAWAWAGKD